MTGLVFAYVYIHILFKVLVWLVKNNCTVCPNIFETNISFRHFFLLWPNGDWWVYISLQVHKAICTV